MNDPLGLSSNGQGALLEFLEDYFTSSDPDSISEDRDDDVNEVLLEGTLQ